VRLGNGSVLLAALSILLPRRWLDRVLQRQFGLTDD